MLEEKNITRIVVNFYVLVFVIVTILIAILMIAYYLTPNNYVVKKYKTGKFALDSQKNYVIEPNSNTLIHTSELANKYIGFDKETNLIIQNFFKSQGIVCLPDELVLTKYSSSVIIFNPTNNPVNLLIKFYNKN
jgi:hypothetical protein